jgi:hypothetical protein
VPVAFPGPILFVAPVSDLAFQLFRLDLVAADALDQRSGDLGARTLHVGGLAAQPVEFLPGAGQIHLNLSDAAIEGIDGGAFGGDDVVLGAVHGVDAAQFAAALGQGPFPALARLEFRGRQLRRHGLDHLAAAHVYPLIAERGLTGRQGIGEHDVAFGIPVLEHHRRKGTARCNQGKGQGQGNGLTANSPDTATGVLEH